MNDPNDFELFLLGGEGRGAPPADAQAAGQGGKKNEGGAKSRASLLIGGTAHAKGRGPSGELGFIR
jgi:hypothetical protein